MKIEIETFACGMSNMYWTYDIRINGKEVPRPSAIYRMYTKEKTAIKNAVKILNKAIKNSKQ